MALRGIGGLALVSIAIAGCGGSGQHTGTGGAMAGTTGGAMAGSAGGATAGTTGGAMAGSGGASAGAGGVAGSAGGATAGTTGGAMAGSGGGSTGAGGVGGSGGSSGRGGSGGSIGGSSGSMAGVSGTGGAGNGGAGGGGAAGCLRDDGAPRLVQVTSVTGPMDTLGGLIAVNGAGATYLLGAFSDIVGFYPQPGEVLSTRPTALRAGLLVKSDGLGNRIWAKRIGSPDTNGTIDVVGIGILTSGNVVILGTLSGTVDLDPGSGVDSQSAPDNTVRAFLLALSPDGARVWSRVLDPAVATYSRGMKVAADGSIYVRGVTGPITSVLKLDATGSPLWTATFQSATDQNSGRSGNVSVGDVARAADGTLWVVGSYAFAADLDPGPGVELRTKGFTDFDSDAVIVKLDDSNGSYRGGWTFGGSSDDIAGSVETSEDAVYVGGDFAGTADFKLVGPPQTMVAQKGSSAFVMRIDPAASSLPTWVYVPGRRRTNLGGIAVASSGVYLTGWWDPTAPADACVAGTLWMSKVTTGGAPVWTISEAAATATSRSIRVNDSKLMVGGIFFGYSNTSPESTSADPFRWVSSAPGGGIAQDLFLAIYDL